MGVGCVVFIQSNLPPKQWENNGFITVAIKYSCVRQLRKLLASLQFDILMKITSVGRFSSCSRGALALAAGAQPTKHEIPLWSDSLRVFTSKVLKLRRSVQKYTLVTRKRGQKCRTWGKKIFHILMVWFPSRTHTHREISSTEKKTQSERRCD